MKISSFKYLEPAVNSVMFWGLFGFQKIDPNERMPRIFMDLVDKSTLYIGVFSRNIFIRLDAVYSICNKQLYFSSIAHHVKRKTTKILIIIYLINQ